MLPPPATDDQTVQKKQTTQPVPVERGQTCPADRSGDQCETRISTRESEKQKIQTSADCAFDYLGRVWGRVAAVSPYTTVFILLFVLSY